MNASPAAREALVRSLGPTLDMVQVDAVAGPLNRAHWLDRLVVAVERAGWIPDPSRESSES